MNYRVYTFGRQEGQGRTRRLVDYVQSSRVRVSLSLRTVTCIPLASLGFPLLSGGSNDNE